MGGATSDHWGLPIEIGPAAAVELSELAAAAAHGCSCSRGGSAIFCECHDAAAAPGPLAEYGSSDDQAEELEADRILETVRLDELVEQLRRELLIERAGRELAERLAERRTREIKRLEGELAQLRRGFRESYTREGKG